VKLGVYEGPLDLLLKLVERQEIAVASVSVCEIVDQFMEYFMKTEFTDVEEGSRFLVIAATLLSVKAQLVLPRPEQAGSERDLDLDEDGDIDVDFGLEYMSIQEAAATLEKRAEDWRLIHKRPAIPFQKEDLPKVNRLDISLLVTAFKEVLKRNVPPEPYEVQAPVLDLWEKIDVVLGFLMQKPEGILFRQLFLSGAGKEELIITFLAILELVYQGKVKVRQEDHSGDIFLAPAC